MPVITVQIDEAAAGAELEGRIEMLELAPLYRQIGEYMLLEVDDRFVRQEAPDGTPWAPLSPATLAAKSTDKILQEKGTRGGLRGRINPAVSEDGVSIGTNLLYAAVHQEGFDGEVEIPSHTRTITQAWGRELDEPKEVEVKAHKRKLTIPARPYLGASEENREVIAEMIHRYVREHL